MGLELGEYLLAKVREEAYGEHRPSWLKESLVLNGFGMNPKMREAGLHPVVKFTYTKKGIARDFHSFLNPEWLNQTPEQCCSNIVTKLVKDADKCLKPKSVGGTGCYRGANKRKRDHVETTAMVINDEVTSVPDDDSDDKSVLPVIKARFELLYKLCEEGDISMAQFYDRLRRLV